MGHKPSLKIINSFPGICLYSKRCTVIPSSVTRTDSRILIGSLVFSGRRAGSVYREIPELTHSIDLLLNKGGN